MPKVLSPCEAATANFELLLQLLTCTLQHRTAIYASVPLTTGPYFLNWYQTVGNKLDKDSPAYWEAHRRDVFVPNAERAGKFVYELRKAEHPRVVVDPSRFDAVGWSQNDYRCFWGLVIENYAEEVVLLDGWEFSSGCSYEFLVASRHGLRVTDQNRRAIPLEVGHGMIVAARQFLQSSGANSDFLAHISDHLEELRNRTKTPLTHELR